MPAPADQVRREDGFRAGWGPAGRPPSQEEIWRQAELLGDSGLRTALVCGTDVRADGTGGLVERQAKVLLAGGIGSEQMRLFCSVVQCCGLPYHPASRLGVRPVLWEGLYGPAECEDVAVEARAASIRARLLLSAVESLERHGPEGRQAAGRSASSDTADMPPAPPEPQGVDDSQQLGQGTTTYRAIRASHIGAAAERVSPYLNRAGLRMLDVSDLPEEYFEPICATCHRNIASDVLGGIECWECYGEH
jgi:hypothetical protein